MRDPLKEPKYGDVFIWNPPTISPMPRPTPRIVLFLARPRAGTWVGMAIPSGGLGHTWFSLDYNEGRKPDLGYWTVAS